MDLETKLSKARTVLLLKHPFFGSLLLGMGLIHDEEKNAVHKTMCVDAENIYFCKEFVEKCTVEQLCGVLMHEIHHVALFHLQRKNPAMNHQIANMAMDYSINWMIAEMERCELPEGALLEQRYRNLTWEDIYSRLMQEIEEVVQQLGGKIDENGDIILPESVFQDGHEEITEDEKRKIVKRLVVTYDALSEKDRGDIPGSIKRIIEDYKNPKVPWERHFRGVAEDIFKRHDYSWSALSNQYRVLMPDFAFPRMTGTMSKLLVCVIDTSGSIGDEEIKMFAPEVDKISQLAEKTIIITCDAAVHEVVETERFSDGLNKIKFAGGGGTSFVPPFEYLREKRITPECLVYFTDGYGDFPNRPNFDVIWCMTPNSISSGDIPFGTVIELDDFLPNKSNRW